MTFFFLVPRGGDKHLEAAFPLLFSFSFFFGDGTCAPFFPQVFPLAFPLAASTPHSSMQPDPPGRLLFSASRATTLFCAIQSGFFPRASFCGFFVPIPVTHKTLFLRMRVRGPSGFILLPYPLSLLRVFPFELVLTEPISSRFRFGFPSTYSFFGRFPGIARPTADPFFDF